MGCGVAAQVQWLQRCYSLQSGRASCRAVVISVSCDAGLDYATADETAKTSLKVIADHIRAVVYLVSDGVIPSNIGRGYVARRLLRRVVLKGRLLGVTQPFVPTVAAVAVALSPGCDPQVQQNSDRIITEIAREEERFLGTIAAGQTMLDKVLERAGRGGGVVEGADAFMMYDTYGFPLELTQEIAEGRGLTVDGPGFDAAMEEQRLRSKVPPRAMSMHL